MMAPQRSWRLQVSLRQGGERDGKPGLVLLAARWVLRKAPLKCSLSRSSLADARVRELKGLMYDKPSGIHDARHAWKGDKDWRGSQTALPDAVFQRNTSVCCDLCLIMKLSLIANAELIRDLYFCTSISTFKSTKATVKRFTCKWMPYFRFSICPLLWSLQVKDGADVRNRIKGGEGRRGRKCVAD